MVKQNINTTNKNKQSVCLHTHTHIYIYVCVCVCVCLTLGRGVLFYKFQEHWQQLMLCPSTREFQEWTSSSVHH